MKKLVLYFKLNILIIIILTHKNAMAYEEPPFNIVHQNDVYEIRHYIDRLAVQANNTTQNSSFRILFNYISGENINSEKIKMTVPVTLSEENSETVMQFYLPSKFTKKTAPVPTDSSIELITIKEGYYAVMQYSGRITNKNFAKHQKILRESLIEDKIKIMGPPIRAFYNGPFTLPIFRRNEAMFLVDWNKL